MKAGSANIKGDATFDATVIGVSSSGILEDTTTSIAAASTFDLDLALGKGDFTWGVIIIVQASPAPAGAIGHTIFVTDNSSDAHSNPSSSYSKYYSKMLPSAFLSTNSYGQDNILLQDAWIDNANSKLVLRFYNLSASLAKTLNVRGTYGVHQ